MAEKTFLEKFNKYQPNDTEIIRVLSDVKYAVRVKKEERIIEADVYFNDIVSKKLLYRIEDEIREAYALNHMKIMPKYNSNLFDYRYFEQILTEVERVGIVARGFFSSCDYRIEGEKITITIPFETGGVTLLKNAETPTIIENIIFSEFSRKFKVNIVSDERLASGTKDKFRDTMAKHDREIAEQSKKYDALANGVAPTSKNEKEQSALDLPRAYFAICAGIRFSRIQNDRGIRSVFVFDCQAVICRACNP